MYERLNSNMRISCVLDAGQLSTAPATPDLIVFPEGISDTEIGRACSTHPNAAIIAAVTEGGRSRGLLLHQGQNQIDYLKVATDGRTTGSGDIQQTPVYKSRDVCIGVLICMDVDHVAFSQSVIAAVKSSESRLKFLCLPADMGSYWFSGDTLSPRFEGMHVILCNHTKTHQDRCKSFVTDTHARKIVVQTSIEPLHVQLN
jgi:hypothetical protein